MQIVRFYFYLGGLASILLVSYLFVVISGVQIYFPFFRCVG